MSLKSDAILVIDGAYALKGASDGMHLDFDKLRSFASNRLRRELKSSLTDRGCLYFSAAPDPVAALQNGFYKFLVKSGWQVFLNRLKQRSVVCREVGCECPHSNSSRPIQDTVQAGVDVHIATKLLTLAAGHEYKCLVLLAGDGDFCDAISWLRGHGHSVWLLGYNDSTSTDLKRLANLNFTDLAAVDVWRRDDAPAYSSKAPSRPRTSGRHPSVLGHSGLGLGPWFWLLLVAVLLAFLLILWPPQPTDR